MIQKIGYYQQKDLWVSYIEVNDKEIFLGTFESRTDAQYAYSFAAELLDSKMKLDSYKNKSIKCLVEAQLKKEGVL